MRMFVLAAVIVWSVLMMGMISQPSPMEVTATEFATRADTTWYEVKITHGKKLKHIDIMNPPLAKTGQLQ